MKSSEDFLRLIKNLFFLIYLAGQGRVEQSIFCLLVYFPHAHNTQNWARLSPRIHTQLTSPIWRAVDPSTCTISTASHDVQVGALHKACLLGKLSLALGLSATAWLLEVVLPTILPVNKCLSCYISNYNPNVIT